MCCGGLHGVANPAYLEGFPFPALLSVAPYCAPGGVRVVSISPTRPQPALPRSRHGSSTHRRALRSTRIQRTGKLYSPKVVKGVFSELRSLLGHVTVVVTLRER